jgi:hypothetical protein
MLQKSEYGSDANRIPATFSITSACISNALILFMHGDVMLLKRPLFQRAFTTHEFFFKY